MRFVKFVDEIKNDLADEPRILHLYDYFLSQVHVWKIMTF